jgi:mono/diheme cytochrome c family protein
MIMKKNTLALVSFLCLAFVLSSCRGDKSAQPPVLLIRNMVEQTSYGPQSSNNFFKDKMATRDPVKGTVAEGEANTNSKMALGIEPGSTLENPTWVKQFPIVITNELIIRGQNRYNIYCTPCHGYAGNSDGLAKEAAGGVIRPANLHDDEIIKRPVGKIYNAITYGVNNWNMPGFSEEMSTQDRWAVVAYVRALQVSKKALVKNDSHGSTK